MIAQLDSMVEGGRGDEQYKNLFYFIMMNLCENHVRMKDQVCFSYMFLMYPLIRLILISFFEGC